MKKLELAFKFVGNHFSFVGELFPWGIPNTNIDGLSNKKDLLSTLINNEQPHTIMITETKMCPSNVSSDYFKCNEYKKEYNVYRKERPSRQGGGVAILVREGIFSMEITEDVYFDTELIAIMINYGPR